MKKRENEVILDNGKYKFYEEPNGFGFKCDRYNEPWRDFVGDSAIYLLYNRVLDQEKEINKLKNVIKNLIISPH